MKVQEIERKRLEDNNKAHLDNETEKVRSEVEQRQSEIKVGLLIHCVSIVICIAYVNYLKSFIVSKEGV